MKNLNNIKNILFDCDGVLYEDLDAVFGQVSQRMTQYISNKLNVDLKKAKERGEEGAMQNLFLNMLLPMSLQAGQDPRGFMAGALKGAQDKSVSKAETRPTNTRRPNINMTEFDLFFVYYIAPVVTVAAIVWSYLYKKRLDREYAEEEIYLKKVGLERKRVNLSFDNTTIKIPSRTLFNFGHYQNTITSKDKPNLLIFKWNVPTGNQFDPIAPTRVFSFKSKQQGKTFPFPSFILRPMEDNLDKYPDPIELLHLKIFPIHHFYTNGKLYTFHLASQI